MRKSLTIPGQADQVSVARGFISELLGSGHPCADTVSLLTSELVTNSVQHSASCRPGETVSVAAITDGNDVVVEVTDLAGPTVPALPYDDDDMAECGRGLWLVQALAVNWGYHRHGPHLTTWFACASARQAESPAETGRAS